MTALKLADHMALSVFPVVYALLVVQIVQLVVYSHIYLSLSQPCTTLCIADSRQHTYTS